MHNLLKISGIHSLVWHSHLQEIANHRILTRFSRESPFVRDDRNHTLLCQSSARCNSLCWKSAPCLQSVASRHWLDTVFSLDHACQYCKVGPIVPSGNAHIPILLPLGAINE